MGLAIFIINCHCQKSNLLRRNWLKIFLLGVDFKNDCKHLIKKYQGSLYCAQTLSKISSIILFSLQFLFNYSNKFSTSYFSGHLKTIQIILAKIIKISFLSNLLCSKFYLQFSMSSRWFCGICPSIFEVLQSPKYFAGATLFPLPMRFPAFRMPPAPNWFPLWFIGKLSSICCLPLNKCAKTNALNRLAYSKSRVRKFLENKNV